MIRVLLLLHRYLGIAVGTLMVMWCVSGVVMMYVAYPSLDENTRLHALEPIEWSGCRKISNEVLGDTDLVSELQIESLAGRAVIYLRTQRQSRLIDLATGSPVARVSPEQAATVARAYANNSQPSAPRLLETIDYDQWTVAGSRGERPLYRFSLSDDAGTEVYVSSVTGRALQVTTARERVWNWLGSIPHWLYFAELRHSAALWSRIVIAASLLGCFLAITGLYIGARRLLLRPDGRWSPYHGFNLWHHVAGLVFGVLTLTWVLSGLLSMNPWGLLEGAGGEQERSQLRGGHDISGAEIKAALQSFAAVHPSDPVSINIAPLNDQMYFIASTAAGDRRRLSSDAEPAPLSAADLAYVGRVLSDGGAPLAPWLMRQEDAYYFRHHRDLAPLPVYRMILADGSATRYYIDPISGELLAKFDRGARGYRWLHQGLHRMDFTAVMRGRPQWDILMLLLVSGVTMVCVTGTYLGYRRLFHWDRSRRAPQLMTKPRGN
jgi:uncharacterized iron-regulated membrane protein